MSPPPSVDWPQVSVLATQTSIRIEDVDWAALGAGEEAAAKAAGKRPTASKRRQAIFTLSVDDTEEGEDADKARERIHRRMADRRLLAIPASCRRVAACNPN